MKNAIVTLGLLVSNLIPAYAKADEPANTAEPSITEVCEELVGDKKEICSTTGTYFIVKDDKMIRVEVGGAHWETGKPGKFAVGEYIRTRSGEGFCERIEKAQYDTDGDGQVDRTETFRYHSNGQLATQTINGNNRIDIRHFDEDGKLTIFTAVYPELVRTCTYTTKTTECQSIPLVK